MLWPSGTILFASPYGTRQFFFSTFCIGIEDELSHFVRNYVPAMSRTSHKVKQRFRLCDLFLCEWFLPEKLQFTVKTQILVISCGNIPRDERSSEHISFLLGRQYLPRYAPLKLENLPFMGTSRSTHTSLTLALLGVVITSNERSSEHVLFLLGRHYFRKTRRRNWFIVYWPDLT
jgi:hypothetical protein